MAPDATTPDAPDVALPDATPARVGRSRPGLAVRGWDLAVPVALVLAWVAGALFVEGFGRGSNVAFLLLDVVAIALLALPLTLIIVTGEIDLSVASVVGLTGAVMGQLWVAGLPLELIVPLCLLLGAVAGALSGVFVTAFGLPSLAVTIGGLALFRGLALVVLGDRAVADFPIEWTTAITASIPGTPIPWVLVPLGLLAVAFGLVLHNTPTGRALFAMGANPEAARFSGIAVERTKFWLFVTSGTVAGLTGVFWTLRYASARADNAEGLELSVIAAVLLGGVSIFGGKGSLPGALAAVLLLGTLRNALQLASVSSEALTIVTGLLLIVSVLAPNVGAAVRRRLRRAHVPAPSSIPSPAGQDGDSVPIRKERP
jgi:rhamnose transport system permease protein